MKRYKGGRYGAALFIGALRPVALYARERLSFPSGLSINNGLFILHP